MKKILITLGLSTTLLLSASITDGKKQFNNKQYTQAYSTFFKVAQDGMIAKYNMAYMNEMGLGVKKNLKTAIDFYRLSANDGYSLAQNTLGNAYLKGIGVKKDIKTAIYYYKLAAKQKNKDAVKALKAIEVALKKQKEIQANFATITIRSNVSNDRVYIDGKYVGKTKIVVPLTSNVTHHIEIKKDGYKTYVFKPLKFKNKEKRVIRAYLRRG